MLSILPPFYPLEAEKKGARPSQYGFVFGLLNLTAFVFSPLFGRYGGKVGSKVLFNVGAFTQGIVGIVFGFLDYVQTATPFLGLSYMLRSVPKQFTKTSNNSFIHLQICSRSRRCCCLGIITGYSDRLVPQQSGYIDVIH